MLFNAKNLIVLTGLMLIANSSRAYAGTYAVVAVDWVPANAPAVGTSGGYAMFDAPNHPFDLKYGILSSVSAPKQKDRNTWALNATASPVVQGLWRWKVRWTGTQGEPHPVSVSAIVQYKGTGHTHTGAFNAGGSGQGRADISDPIFSIGSLANSGSVGIPIYDEDDSPSNGTNNIPEGAADSVRIGTIGNVWEGEVLMGVNSGAALSAKGNVSNGVVSGEGGASVTLDVIARLTYVGGQRVQPDL